MLIEHPQDLKKIISDTVIYSYSQLEELIQNSIQPLKSSSALEYTEIYRGHSKISYKLESRLSRIVRDAETMEKAESQLIQDFEKSILTKSLTQIEEKEVFSKEFERNWKILFQCQHLGLITRLLDWTIDWKIALLFAVQNEEYFGLDAHLWVFFSPKKWRIVHEEIYSIDPKFITSPILGNPSFHLSENMQKQTSFQRIIRQSGRFFIQSYEQSLLPLEENEEIKPYIFKFIIDGNSKKEIKQKLSEFGITTNSVYHEQDEYLNQAIDTINENLKKLK